LQERGIAIESAVDWPRGGRSLYFRDPDRHLLELITPGCWSIY
jgi:catechol 2,3-dioxygenase-like lactoylglutathione lyase family enzyme